MGINDLFHNIFEILRDSFICRRYHLISSKYIAVRLQKQRNRGVFRKKYSENWREDTYGELHWNHTSAWVFSYKFAAYFRAPVLRTPLMDCFWSLLFLRQIMKENRCWFKFADSMTNFSICFGFVKNPPCGRLYNIQIVLWKMISWLFSLLLNWFS